MEDNRKKVVVPLIIGILCMFILLGGATYAYFVTNTTNSFGTKTITGQADATGSVALIGTNASLYLNLDRTLMAQGENDITYWAVTTNTAPSTTQNVVTVGSTSVNGAGYFNCSYTLNVAASGTNNMYTAFQGMSGKSTEQIVLNIGGNTYDFNTASLFPITVSGTLNGVSSSNIQSITAEFYLKNKSSVNQRALAGTDLSITITATSFTCTQVEDPNDYLDVTRLRNFYGANAINNITFLNTTNVPETCYTSVDVSEKQNGSIIASWIDTDPQCRGALGYGDLYIGQNGGVKAPRDSSGLLGGIYYTINGLEYLDTSHVTNMDMMFAGVGCGSSGSAGASLDLRDLDTSNVTSMSQMFEGACFTSLNIAGWDTSKVTDMSLMFEGLRHVTSLDLSALDTANVTNMQDMIRCEGYGSLQTVDVSSFDTSNVTNMNGMFYRCENLTTIYASSSFVTTGLLGDADIMFEGCYNLVGGNGTTYDDETYDMYWINARIDAPGTPGYFTLRS